MELMFTSLITKVKVQNGYDGTATYYVNISDFRNNPTLLPIDEFIAMTEGEQFARGEEVDVRDIVTGKQIGRAHV